MKTSKISIGIVLAATLSSCNMNNEQIRPDLSNQIKGTYTGTLTSSLTQTEMPATAEISSINDYTIQVRCYSAGIDTTFSLGLYPDGNMMRACLTGNDFKNQYGHNMSCCNQMMGNMSNGTSWPQHMNAEHNVGDKHYGYFDMNAKTFNYTFNFMDAGSPYTQYFMGRQ